MSIVSTEIESVHGADTGRHLVFYRCQDSQGNWHDYGPVVTIDDNFDANAFKTAIAAKVSAALAAAEFEQVIG